jgi:CheY-like chemotaxis protein
VALDHYEDSRTERQRLAIAAFNRARHETESALAGATQSRETHMDAARRLEVLKREHAAITARSRLRARARAEAPGRLEAPTAVVAHRHPWFSEKVVELLRREDVDVVEDHLDNGADAVGVAVAEQPDLVMVEDGLLMMPGEEVVREMRRFCERTLIAARADGPDRRAALLAAGADTVTTRGATPLEAVRQALSLLARRGDRARL